MHALVTGAGGFLGTAVATQLVARGVRVRSLARGDYPHLSALGVSHHRGDVADADAVNRAAAGCDVVFHVAAKAGVGGRPADYERANVVGTRNVIDACRTHGIRKLVFTSSPSVVSGRNLEGVDESEPYPATYLADYPRTKAISEREVLAANDATLFTVALRPHLIWGPGDNHLLPRLIARVKDGTMRLIGDGRNRVDVTYVTNAADAHLLAMDKLGPGSPVNGRAYFISDGAPVAVADFINRSLAAAGLPPVTRTVPAGVAYALGAVQEWAWRLLRRTDEPRMTRFLATQMSTAHWFDIGAARRDLGYAPAVDLDEGMRRLAAWLAGIAPAHGDPN